MTTRTKGKDMKKAKLSLAWQIVIGLVLGVAIGALLNHFSAEKAWWISNVLQPAGDIFIRLIKMIVVPIVISSLIVGIAGVGDAKKLGSIGLKTIIYFEVVTTIAIVVGLVLANLFHPGAGIDMSTLVPWTSPSTRPLRLRCSMSTRSSKPC